MNVNCNKVNYHGYEGLFIFLLLLFCGSYNTNKIKENLHK